MDSFSRCCKFVKKISRDSYNFCFRTISLTRNSESYDETQIFTKYCIIKPLCNKRDFMIRKAHLCHDTYFDKFIYLTHCQIYTKLHG